MDPLELNTKLARLEQYRDEGANIKAIDGVPVRYIDKQTLLGICNQIGKGNKFFVVETYDKINGA